MARFVFHIIPETPTTVFSVVLYEPEIPPNTGNIIRLCANTGAELHLVKPLGFPLDSAKMRRAGLDYAEWARMSVHDDWASCLKALAGRRMFAMSTKGHTAPSDIDILPGDVFVFGPETRGLPEKILTGFEPQMCLRLPMLPESRSMNLSNAVAVTVYEAWRQNHFAGAAVRTK